MKFYGGVLGRTMKNWMKNSSQGIFQGLTITQNVVYKEVL